MNKILTTACLVLFQSYANAHDLNIVCLNNPAHLSGPTHNLTLTVSDSGSKKALRDLQYGELLGVPGPNDEIIVRGLNQSDGFIHRACHEGICTPYYLKVELPLPNIIIHVIDDVRAHEVCRGGLESDGSCLGGWEPVPAHTVHVGSTVLTGCNELPN
jgi:hypothetical protein